MHPFLLGVLCCVAIDILAGPDAPISAHAESKVSEQVTVSIGVATLVPDGSLPAAALLDRGDAALYRAKQQGRNRVLSA
jgi:diguanylate cyclase (GGDEF)-like protein